MDPSIRWPLARNMIRGNKVSITFGEGIRIGQDGKPRTHQGWDFEAPVGTPCFAIADGRIEFTSNSPGGLGKTVALAFSFEGRKLYAVYGHLSAIDVATGQMVKRGDQVGRTGDSGNALGFKGKELHLHFEIRTVPMPGLGTAGRLTPKTVFGHCPLHEAVLADGAAPPPAAPGPAAPAAPAAPPAPPAAPAPGAAAVPISGRGWEIHIRRHSVQSRDGETRTVGAYQVYHDGRPAASFRLGDKDVPLAGTTAEPKGPGQNEVPATKPNPSRIRPGTYPLATQDGGSYVTFDYRPETDEVVYPLPGIELLGTGNRTEILIHPGKNEFVSSIGCINLCTKLPRPEENIDFPGSRRRVIALIEDMKAYLGSRFPTSNAHPIPEAAAVIDGEP